MKARRQAEILAIIQEYDIETQDQLLEKLREKGMKIHPSHHLSGYQGASPGERAHRTQHL